MRLDRAPAPWTQAQLRLVFAANGVALATIVIAERGTHAADDLGDQIPWLNLAVVGLVIGSATHGALVFLARRAIGRRRLGLLPDVTTVAPVEHAPHNGGWCWVPGTLRAHRPTCLLVAGRSTDAVDAAQIRADALVRCELCG